ncbi:MAG: RNA polymerase sigma factor [Pseudomonadota bacterium]
MRADKTDTELAGIFRSHWLALLGRSRRIVDCHHTAEDIAQEAFLKWFVKIRSGQAVRGQNVGLLYRIVHGLSIDALRKRSRLQSKSGPPEQTEQVEGSESVVAMLETAERAEKALADLPERTRRAFLMRRDLGMSFREIGDELGVSTPRAHKLTANAMSAMMACLDD